MRVFKKNDLILLCEINKHLPKILYHRNPKNNDSKSEVVRCKRERVPDDPHASFPEVRSL